MMKTKKKVAIVLESRAHLREMLRVYRALNEAEDFETIIIFESMYDASIIQEDVEKTQRLLGVEILVVKDGEWCSERLKWAYELCKKLIGKCNYPRWDKIIPYVILQSILFKFELEYRKRISDLINLDLLILPFIPTKGGTIFWKKIVQQKKLPVFLVPYCFYQPKELSDSAASQHMNGMSFFANRLWARLFPKWVIEAEGVRCLSHPTHRAITLEFCGLAPELPNRVHGAHVDAILVEGSYLEKKLKSDGFDQDKLRLTGALADDELFLGLKNRETKRKQLFEELGKKEPCKIILAQIPTNQMSWQKAPEFRDFSDLVGYYTSVAFDKPDDWIVLLCLHPRMEKEYEPICQKMQGRGIYHTKKETIDLMPICDLYVSSLSSTLRWAVVCHKPAINFTPYENDFEDFKEAPGISCAYSKQEFENEFKKLTTDNGYYQEMKIKQKQFSENWGRLDGHSGKRFLEVCRELTG